MNLKLLFLLVTLLFTASKASAAPYVWTIPQTAMGDGSTISGSFTYDTAASPPVSSVNIVKTAPNSQTYNIVGLSNANYVRAAAGAGNNVPAIYLTITGIPAGGGTLTKLANSIGVGVCDQTTGCTNVASVGGSYINNSASVIYTTQVLQSEAIPTISEWAMLFMASLMAMLGYTRLRSRRA